jgi:hypothetical protein
MRLGCIAVLSCLVAFVSYAEKAEVIWECRFDNLDVAKETFSVEGCTEFTEGTLHTKSDPNGPTLDGAVTKNDFAIPKGVDGYYLRLEWALVPVKIGGWGQDCNIGGPFVVEFTGARPTLNAKYPARDLVEENREVVMSCDFNNRQVFGWTINGKQQLDAPVPAWRSDYSEAKIAIADFKDTNSETRWLWMRLSKIVPDDKLQVLLSGWDEIGAPRADEHAPFLLGQTNAMDKVFREAADYRGSLNPIAKIFAAGRERESFQLVVIPSGTPLKSVSIECSDLLHSDGKTRFQAGRISWGPVGYVQTQNSKSAIQRVGWQWPDVVTPAHSFDVEAGFVQPIWFTVDVPADATPGLYRGVIYVKAEGGAERLAGLELNVRPYSLPVRGALKTAFCISPGIWEMWNQPDEVKKRLGMDDKTGHGPLYTSNECEDVLPTEKWREMYDFLLAHRLSPTVIYSGLKNGKTRVVPAKEDMEYCYERGMNATCLACVDVLPSDPAEADEKMTQLEAWFREWEGFVKEKNWPDFTWYIHGFDESEMRPDPVNTVDPSIHRVEGMVGEKYPWLKRETANPYTAKHSGMFDIWTPLTSQITELSAPVYRERQAAGEEAWAYVCCGPLKPYANLFIDYPGVDPRILGWQFRQHNLTGFLYYLMNLYEFQENWNMPGPKWPDKPWNALSFGTNSDGILFYPGPDATPLPSTRMENLRDGIEDYEALTMLADLVGKAEQAGGHDDFLQRARPVIAVRPEVSKSWTEYVQEPNAIIAARSEVDDLIIEAMSFIK